MAQVLTDGRVWDRGGGAEGQEEEEQVVSLGDLIGEEVQWGDEPREIVSAVRYDGELWLKLDSGNGKDTG